MTGRGGGRARVWGFQGPETATGLADALVGPLSGLRTEPDAGTGAFFPSDDALRAGPRVGIPVKVVTDSGAKLDTDSGQSGHRSERSDAGA